MPKVDKKPLAERLTKAKGQGPQPPPICSQAQIRSIEIACEELQANCGLTLRQIRAAVDYLVERQQWEAS